MKAMIFAAGLGTRLKPLTLEKPKALVELNGKPLLDYQIEKLKKYGFDEIIVNVHHFAEEVKKHLSKNNFGIKIEISDESQKLLDTGGGLKKAAWFFRDTKSFLLHNVDIISDLDLTEVIKHHEKRNSLATLVVRKRTTSRYLLFDSEKTLAGWENTKTGERIIKKDRALQRFAFSGISVFNSRILELFPDKEVFSIIELLLSLADKEKITAYEDNSSYWFDVGSIEKLKEAENLLKTLS